MTGEEIKNELIYLPKGWVKAFGKKMIDELIDLLITYDVIDRYEIYQVKEKWGILEWYDNVKMGAAEDVFNEGESFASEFYVKYDEWLDKYRKMSEFTCAVCGKRASILSKGYILPLCRKCAKEK